MVGFWIYWEGTANGIMQKIVVGCGLCDVNEESRTTPGEGEGMVLSE